MARKPSPSPSSSAVDVRLLDDPFGDEDRDAELQSVFAECRDILMALNGVMNSQKGTEDAHRKRVERFHRLVILFFDNRREADRALRNSLEYRTAFRCEFVSRLIDEAVRQIELFDNRTSSVRYDQFHAGQNTTCENPYSERRFEQLAEYLSKTFGNTANEKIRAWKREYFESRLGFEATRKVIVERDQRRQKGKAAGKASGAAAEPAVASTFAAARSGDSPQAPPPEDAAESWPPDDGWHFRDGQYAFGGKSYNLGGRMWNLLKRLAEARRPLTKDDMKSENGEEDSVRTDLAKLRNILRKNHLLPKKFDPIPFVQKANPTTWNLCMNAVIADGAPRRIRGK